MCICVGVSKDTIKGGYTYDVVHVFVVFYLLFNKQLRNVKLKTK